MSRRKSNKTSRGGGGRFPLIRGVRSDDLVAVDFQPLAALDVTCPGRGQEGCKRLIRYEITDAGTDVVYRNDTISKPAHWVPDAAWTEMVFTCRCGRTSVIRLDKVRATLAQLIEQDRRNLRVSAASLATVRPPAL